jgi:hypothetical protein
MENYVSNIFALKNSRNFRYLLLIPIALILFILTRKLFLFALFVGITCIIVYYTKLVHFPIDVSPLFFLEIVITKYYKFGYTLLFILLAYIIPKAIAGTSMHFDSYLFILISLISNLVVLFFPMIPLQILGYLTSVIQYIGGAIYQSTFKPVFLCLADGFANVLNNLLWFLIFSEISVMLM